jgi:ribosomal protein S12 methylthiotransferase accessory factor
MAVASTPYRSVSVHEAVDTALREARRLGVHLRVETIGPPSYPTTVSRMIRGATELAVGYGKGPGSQALASAHFEALERYLMSAADNARLAPGATRLMTAAEVARQPGLGPDLVLQRWAEDFPDSVAACASHRGGGGPVWYPVFLSDPRYFRGPMPGDSTAPYRSLLRYSSSLGTAAGVSTVEAVFHGLCELIEHDGVSLALLRWFVAGRSEFKLVDPDGLPDRLRMLYRDAMDAAGERVHLLDVTTDLGVPVYLAVAQPDDSLPAITGAGAAPDAHYAAERALSELIQCCAFTWTRNATKTAKLAAWPALRDCAMLPVQRMLSGGRTVALPDGGGSTRPEDALDWLIARLRRLGIEPYVCDVAPPDSLVAVATTIVPGMERFSLVRHGVPVTPTGRGWRLWTEAKPAADAAGR